MNPRILLVDDDISRDGSIGPSSYMWYYAEACRAQGWHVVEASSPAEAIRRLQGEASFDLVVLDMMMPPDVNLGPGADRGLRTGCVLAERLLQDYPSLPIVFLTSAMSDDLAHHVRKLPNVKRYLFKYEVTPSLLCDELADILGPGARRSEPVAQQPVDGWRAMITGEKERAFDKFLHTPDQLSASEFLALADVARGVLDRFAFAGQQSFLMKSELGSADIQTLFNAARTEAENHKKGALLEALVQRLFSSVEGFCVRTRLHTRTEEIDLFILNGSNEAPWRHMGPAMIGECKNWTAKCGTEDYNHFETKLLNRRGQCKCGFFISWNGFTSRFLDQRLRSSREDYVIVLLDGNDLADSVDSSDFAGLIRRRWEEAVGT